jgi:hypothetical protein
LAKEDVAILLVHHSRKSGGEQFVGSRGSGGLPSFCEIIIEFARASPEPKETKRILTAMGRYKQTPTKLMCELQSGRYVGLGDPDDPAVRAEHKSGDWASVIMDIFEQQGKNWTSKVELQQRVREVLGHGVRNADLIVWLANMVEEGEIEQKGKGTKGSEKAYRIAQFETEDPEECEDPGSD